MPPDDSHHPGIIYGTAWKKADTARLVRTAIQRGFRGIDTACQPKHYDEAGVGAGVALCLNAALVRADLYLQTKFTPVSGQDPASIPYDPAAPLAQQVHQSFAASLRNLRTNYLDCLILHSPLAGPKQTQEVWRAMESLAAGRRSEPSVRRHRLRPRDSYILQEAADHLPEFLDSDRQPAHSRARHHRRLGKEIPAHPGANILPLSDTKRRRAADRNPVRSSHARGPGHIRL